MPLTTTKCPCGVSFDYEYKGRAQVYCPLCKVAHYKATKLRIRSVIKLPDDHLSAGNKGSSRFQLRVRTREQVAEDLALWEFWEQVKTSAVDPDAPVPEYKELTASRIDQIEKEALHKLRIKLAPYYEEYMAGKGSEAGCSNRFTVTPMPNGYDLMHISTTHIRPEKNWDSTI